MSHFSAACAIELVTKVVVTGGKDSKTRVQAYNNNGPLEQLPDLLEPRLWHACGHFQDSANRIVIIFKVSNICPIVRYVLLLLGVFGDRGFCWCQH